MEYTTKFSQDIKRRLENLRSAIDQDIGSLDNSVPNLTFSQADHILGSADSLLDSYRGFMVQLYRGVGKTYGSRRSGNSGGSRSKMEPAALEMIQSQGYLFEKDFVEKYSFNRNAVSRKLQELALTYGWERARDNEKQDWRYTLKKDEPAAPSTQEPPVIETPAVSENEKTSASKPRRKHKADPTGEASA